MRADTGKGVALIPQHSSQTVEHYTPHEVIELAREVMGGIDLDPASCAAAQQMVKAGRWIGLPRDGLAESWGTDVHRIGGAVERRRSRVFLNPPGGVITDTEERARWGTKSRACAWWRKMCEEIRDGHVSQAIFVGFTLEILRSAQGDERWPSPLSKSFSLCIPAKRLRFGGAPHPTHANVIVYWSGRGAPDYQEREKRFRALFGTLGEVRDGGFGS